MKKYLMTTLLVTAGIVMLGGNVSKAALQANSTTHASPLQKTGPYWMEEIRKMETEGQTMGLTEELNADLTTKTGTNSNNIDVHMMRTTEYGAMAILSASGFGNPKKLSEVEIQTTTGNVTGVYIDTTRWEWTAGVKSADTVGKNARYYDLYESTNASAKPGDALGTDSTPNKGCARWHGAGGSDWFSGANYGFLRGNGGIFSFGGYVSWSSNVFCGRGVAVVQSGV